MNTTDSDYTSQNQQNYINPNSQPENLSRSEIDFDQTSVLTEQVNIYQAANYDNTQYNQSFQTQDGQSTQYSINQNMPYGAAQDMQYGSSPNMQYNMMSGYSQPNPPRPKKPVNKKLIIAISSLLVLIIGAIGGIWFYLNNRTVEIDLTDYYSFEFDGYDTRGTVSYTFDYDAFYDDFDDKIKIYEGKKERGYSVEETFIKDCFEGGVFDKSYDLTNGESVIFTIDFNSNKALSKYHIKLETDTIQLTVEDLNLLQELDPFTDIEVTFSGIAPNGYAEITNNSSDSYVKNMYFYISDNQGLSNGDTVVVTLGEDIDYYIDTYGIFLTATEKEYTVSGLGKYVTELSEIPEDTLNKMKQESEDAFNAHVANYWAQSEGLTGHTYVGCYFLTPKDGTNDYPLGYNTIYLVYKTTATLSFPEDDVYQDVEYYHCTAFNNIMLLEDGTCTLDYSDYEYKFDKYEVYVDVDWGKTFYYYGYKTIDTLFNKRVTAYIDTYNYESDILE